MNIAKRYDQPRKVTLACEDESRTKQSFRDESDVNLILKRYKKTGELPGMIQRRPEYGQFAEAPDFMEACALVLKAEEQFNALPAHVRTRFQNRPENFLAFTHDPANAEEMVKLGLMKREAVKRVEDARTAAKTAPKGPKKDPGAEGDGAKTSNPT